MKRICNLSTFTFLIIYLMIILVTSCKTEDPNKPKLPPLLTTSAITNITQNTANCGGTVISDNGLDVTARGVCWSLKPNPTINDSISKDSLGMGEFRSSISRLIDDTTYYVRAYATNTDGTAYGFQVTFKTLASVLPVLTTTVATDIAISTATSGGNITFNGGSAITARGVCWSTSQNPTILNDKTSDGVNTGTFTSNIDNLIAGTTYYLRAYATNKTGIGYGIQTTFKTQYIHGTVTDIDGNVYNTVIIGTQNWMTENLKTTKYKDGTTIPLVTDGTAWKALATGGYCLYNNAATYKSTYGALYNWYSVNTGILAPEGWHVSTNAEWSTLVANLGTSISVAKELTNSSGFNALRGGCRNYTGSFNYVGANGYWWSSNEYNTTNAWPRYLMSGYDNLFGYDYQKGSGYSVRCVKD